MADWPSRLVDASDVTSHSEPASGQTLSWNTTTKSWDYVSYRPPFLPSDNAFLAANFDPAYVAGGTAPTSGNVSYLKLWVPATITVANAELWVITVGATLTSGQNLAGLYSAGGTLIAKTATQHTNWTSTGRQSMALTAEAGQSLTITGGPTVYVHLAILSVGTTPPAFARTFAAASASAPVLNAGLSSPDYRWAVATGATSLASTRPALATLGTGYWGAVS